MCHTEANAILKYFPVHPSCANYGSDFVRLMPDDPELQTAAVIVPLIQQDFIGAVIGPAPHKEQILEEQSILDPRVWAENQTIESHYRSRIIPGGFPEISYRPPDHYDIPQLCITELNKAEEYVLYGLPARQKVQWYVFHAKGGDLFAEGFAPKLHTDQGLNSYTCLFGAGMQAMPKRLDAEELRVMDNYKARRTSDQLLNLGAYWRRELSASRDLINLTPGERVIYGANFVHGSSTLISQEGQLAVDLSYF